MQSKMKKQKRRLIWRIGVVLFCVLLVLSSVYTAVVINIKEDEFVSKATKNCTNLYQNLTDIHSTDYEYTIYRYIDLARLANYYNYQNTDTSISKGYKNDIYYYDSNIRITAKIQDAEGSTSFDTNDSTILSFAYLDEYYETRRYEDGFLYYEDFIDSITSEQYEEIKDYLRIKPDKDGNYYELLCTEYYCNEDSRVFIPKTIEIVLSNHNNTWYAQDTVIKTYPLTPKDTEDCVLRQLARDARNVIPDQFVSGDFISDINTDITDVSDNDHYGLMSDVQVEFPFLYTYSGICSTDGYYLVTTEPAVTTEDYIISTEEYTNSQAFESIGVFLEINYTEQLNILIDSAPLLLAGYGIIFLFLLVIGIILCLSLWTIIKTQAEEEQKRREVTNALAHDIKTPLFIIEGYAQSLKENLHTEKREHYANRIMERTKECNRLVHQMLNFSSLDSPDFSLNIEEVEVESLLREVIADFSQVSDISRIHLDAEKSCTISADRELLRRALTNLVDNALRYSDRNTEIQIILTDKKLSISNVCSHITEADVKHMTEPFYRAEKNRSTEGSGLGLAMVESVAKHHGFTLSANLRNNLITITLIFSK